MKITVIVILAFTACLLFARSVVAGSAYPEKNGGKYLEARGYSTAFVARLIKGERLEPSEVITFSKSKSSDVRYLVARNPTLTASQIDFFIAHRDDFTRSGAASNLTLSASQIEILTDDRSHTVFASLAQNPALSKSALLRVHTKRNPGLLWFAMNPNCPDSIEKEIAASHDTLAINWLEITRKRKNEDFYGKDKNGRWVQGKSRG